MPNTSNKSDKIGRSARVGQMIRDYRERNNVTQLTLAKELGYDYGNFIGMIETGRSIFPLEHWKKYATAIEANQTEFLVAVLTDLYPDMEPILSPLLKKKK